MNILDLGLLGLLALAGWAGHRLGFVRRLLSWLGMVVGLAVTARFLPTLVEATGVTSPTSRFVVAAALVVGASAAGLSMGLAAGARVHLALPSAGHGADRALGAAAGVLAVVTAVWLLTPVMADVPGRLSRLARGSGVARTVAAATPPPPDTVDVLRRLVGTDAFPPVLTGLRPSPDAGSPPADTGVPDGVLAAASASAVRVEARACGRVQEGSGFVVEPGLVVTNAHVVAGAAEGDVDVLGSDRRRIAGTVVLFDPRLDLALVAAPLGAAPLELADPRAGGTGAVLGHPSGGSLRAAPFAVAEQIRARGRDLYGDEHVERAVLVLASELTPGDSGAGLVDAAGRVVGVAFAVAPDDADTAYAVHVDELRAALARPRGDVTAAGACLP